MQKFKFLYFIGAVVLVLVFLAISLSSNKASTPVVSGNIQEPIKTTQEFESDMYTSSGGPEELCPPTSGGAQLSYAEAARIAQMDCSAKGEVGAKHYCNPTDRVWWIDMKTDNPQAHACPLACIVIAGEKKGRVVERCSGDTKF